MKLIVKDEIVGGHVGGGGGGVGVIRDVIMLQYIMLIGGIITIMKETDGKTCPIKNRRI
jgi:hypothetical protein